MYISASNFLSPEKNTDLLNSIAKIPVTAGGVKNLLPDFHKLHA